MKDGTPEGNAVFLLGKNKDEIIVGRRSHAYAPARAWVKQNTTTRALFSDDTHDHANEFAVLHTDLLILNFILTVDS